MAHHLHGIEVQQHASAAAACPDRVNGLQGSHLALSPDQRQQSGRRPQQGLQPVDVQQT